MKVGVYGGTFDPIHCGHLILAREAMEKLALERMIFVPNTISPHKLDREPTAPDVRAEMVAAAIEGEPGFEMDECELRADGPSYAIDTILHLREERPDAELHYLIGQDNVAKLGTWRRIDEIMHMAQFVVLNRHDDSESLPHLTLHRRVDISATDIRHRVRTHLSIRYLVPESVRAIIERENLYQAPTHQL